MHQLPSERRVGAKAVDRVGKGIAGRRAICMKAACGEDHTGSRIPGKTAVAGMQWAKGGSGRR